MQSTRMTVVTLNEEEVEQALENYIREKNANFKEAEFKYIEVYAECRHKYRAEVAFEFSV